MADQIIISGCGSWDGEYEFDIVGAPLTTREWGWIKRHAGYLPMTIDEGLNDPELIVVFAVIALRRAGRVDDRDWVDTYEELIDNPFGQGKIRYVPDPSRPKEAGPGPPQSSSSSNDDTTGLESKTSSATSLDDRRRSGAQSSDGAESAQARSAT